MKLKKDFYTRTNVLEVARDLIGKVLVTQTGDIYTSGIITETEGYNGIHDRACHAYGGRRTNRTEVMYQEGGRTYIYLCYGIHALFNVVTNAVNTPDAVLIRATYPLDGIDHMLKRRNKVKVDKTLSGGPGTVAAALGLTLDRNGTLLSGDQIWIEDRNIYVDKDAVSITPRIGVESAGEAALLPYRFVVSHKVFNSLVIR